MARRGSSTEIKGAELRVEITYGALTYNYMSFGRLASFFGELDARLNILKPMEFVTDANTRFRTVIKRGRLSARGPVREYFKARKIKAGDVLCISRRGKREFEIRKVR